MFPRAFELKVLFDHLLCDSWFAILDALAEIFPSNEVVELVPVDAEEARFLANLHYLGPRVARGELDSLVYLFLRNIPIHALSLDAEDVSSGSFVRKPDVGHRVQPSRSDQCVVKNVWPVRRSDDHHSIRTQIPGLAALF